jgi:hypothetical protein
MTRKEALGILAHARKDLANILQMLQAVYPSFFSSQQPQPMPWAGTAPGYPGTGTTTGGAGGGAGMPGTQWTLNAPMYWYQPAGDLSPHMNKLSNDMALIRDSVIRMGLILEAFTSFMHEDEEDGKA